MYFLRSQDARSVIAPKAVEDGAARKMGSRASASALAAAARGPDDALTNHGCVLDTVFTLAQDRTTRRAYCQRFVPIYSRCLRTAYSKINTHLLNILWVNRSTPKI